MNHEREYKSLEQARALLKQWGSWGAHRAYVGDKSIAPLYAIAHLSGWGFILGTFITSMRATNGTPHIQWLLDDGHGLFIGIALIVLLKSQLFWDNIRLPTMVYKANTGTTKIVNPVTPLNGQ